MDPFRISIVGIDGSGKSTTTLKAIQNLSHRFSICKTGRNPFFIYQGGITPCLPKIADFFEKLFKRVDATRRRTWIGLTRFLFVLFQGWLEPYMIRRYRPVLIMTTRCMIIDPVVYSHFYYPTISRKMDVAKKLMWAQKCSGLPFRDLYFFLDTPIQMAIERIYKRISIDHPETTYGRDYWLHLHEHEATLQVLDQKFRQTLEIAQNKSAFHLIEIDTRQRDEKAVAEVIAHYTRMAYQGFPLERRMKVV
ncbi:MAG: hypothetical protein N3G78_12755 [Desulfobacterota bacterium]|nr:hypothetical protein [Thermodesulfobacteriota bacterium]